MKLRNYYSWAKDEIIHHMLVHVKISPYRRLNSCDIMKFLCVKNYDICCQSSCGVFLHQVHPMQTALSYCPLLGNAAEVCCCGLTEGLFFLRSLNFLANFLMPRAKLQAPPMKPTSTLEGTNIFSTFVSEQVFLMLIFLTFVSFCHHLPLIFFNEICDFLSGI